MVGPPSYPPMDQMHTGVQTQGLKTPGRFRRTHLEQKLRGKEKFLEFVDVYQSDLPGVNAIEPELLMWEVY